MSNVYFKCSRESCFGCVNGKCIILVKGYKDDMKCPFYKTKEEYLELKREDGTGDLQK